MIAVLLITLLITIISNVPIAICLGLSSASALWVGTSTPLTLLAQRLFTSVDVTTLWPFRCSLLPVKSWKRVEFPAVVELSYDLSAGCPVPCHGTVLSCMSSPRFRFCYRYRCRLGGFMVPVMV
jgi:hypothetical protein